MTILFYQNCSEVLKTVKFACLAIPNPNTGQQNISWKDHLKKKMFKVAEAYTAKHYSCIPNLINYVPAVLFSSKNCHLLSRLAELQIIYLYCKARPYLRHVKHFRHFCQGISLFCCRICICVFQSFTVFLDILFCSLIFLEMLL